MTYMTYNKIIFLDIDGVLSTGRAMFEQWDIEAMDNLLMLIEKTNAHIVISSSWRDIDNKRMLETFKEHGCYKEIIDRIIGITIRGHNELRKGSKLPIVRGVEIKEWVDHHLVYPWYANPEIEQDYAVYKDGQFKHMRSNKLNKDYFYVILDDDMDMLLEQGLNFVKTDINVGLTTKDVEKAIKILNPHETIH